MKRSLPTFRQPLIDRNYKPKLSEADIQRACTELLELDGWRAIRSDPVSDRSRGKGFGEVGMPDYLYIRYWAGYRADAVTDCEGQADLITEAQVLWIEYKAPGKRPAPHQARWHRAERSRGALLWVVDDIDQFRKDYAASGLARNVR